MNLIKIDELLLPDHHHLTENDDCYFLETYSSGKTWSHSDGNKLISNLKISPLHKGTKRYYWKTEEIKKIAANLQRTIPALGDLSGITFVPIPPSKTKDHELYDDRIAQILSRINLPGYQYKDMLYTIEDRDGLHESSKKRDIDEIAGNMAIDYNQVKGVRNRIVLVDDMVTTGASFCAARSVILDEFPDAEVSGLFVTRRQPPTIQDLFGDLLKDFEL
jgi:hypothetical protein